MEKYLRNMKLAQESIKSDAYEIQCMQRIVDDIRSNCPNDRIEVVDGIQLNKGQLYSIIKSFNSASLEKFNQLKNTASQLNTKLSSLFPDIQDIENVDWFIVHTGSHAYTSDILVISRTSKNLKPISGMPELNSYKYGSIEIKRYKSSKLFQPQFILKNDNGQVRFALSHAYISYFNQGFKEIENILLDAIYQSDEYVEFNKQFLYAVSNEIAGDIDGHDDFTDKLRNTSLPFNSPQALQAYIDRVGTNYVIKNLKIFNFEQLLAKYYFDAYSEGFRQTPFMQIGNGKNAQLFKLNLSESTISQYDPLNIRPFAKNFSDVFNSITLSIRIRPDMNYKIVADMHFSSKLRQNAFSYDPNGSLPPKRNLA